MNREGLNSVGFRSIVVSDEYRDTFAKIYELAQGKENAERKMVGSDVWALCDVFPPLDMFRQQPLSSFALQE